MNENDTEAGSGIGQIEQEAITLVEIFNSAVADHSSLIEWNGMHYDRESGEEQFVFESEGYMDSAGIAALRGHARIIQYIEAYEYDGVVFVQIYVPVRGSVYLGADQDGS